MIKYQVVDCAVLTTVSVIVFFMQHSLKVICLFYVLTAGYGTSSDDAHPCELTSEMSSNKLHDRAPVENMTEYCPNIIKSLF